MDPGFTSLSTTRCRQTLTRVITWGILPGLVLQEFGECQQACGPSRHPLDEYRHLGSCVVAASGHCQRSSAFVDGAPEKFVALVRALKHFASGSAAREMQPARCGECHHRPAPMQPQRLGQPARTPQCVLCSQGSFGRCEPWSNLLTRVSYWVDIGSSLGYEAL